MVLVVILGNVYLREGCFSYSSQTIDQHNLFIVEQSLVKIVQVCIPSYYFCGFRFGYFGCQVFGYLCCRRVIAVENITHLHLFHMRNIPSDNIFL
ncbi:hypothetical protein ES708_15572 [subsurface metagenome]